MKTGATWINGKPIYRKVVEFGYLPNAGSKSIPHGITGIEQVVRLDAIATGSDGNNIFLGYSDTFQVNCNSSIILIATSFDARTINAIVILEYTKASN